MRNILTITQHTYIYIYIYYNTLIIKLQNRRHVSHAHVCYSYCYCYSTFHPTQDLKDEVVTYNQMKLLQYSKTLSR